MGIIFPFIDKIESLRCQVANRGETNILSAILTKCFLCCFPGTLTLNKWLFPHSKLSQATHYITTQFLFALLVAPAYFPLLTLFNSDCLFTFLRFIFFILYVYLCYVYLHVCAHTCSTWGGQKKALDTLGLETQLVVTAWFKVPGSKLGSPGRGPSSFSDQKTLITSSCLVFCFVLFSLWTIEESLLPGFKIVIIINNLEFVFFICLFAF